MQYPWEESIENAQISLEEIIINQLQLAVEHHRKGDDLQHKAKRRTVNVFSE